MDVGASSNITVQFESSMDATSLTSSNVVLRDYQGNAIPAAISYNASTKLLTVDPTSNLPVTQQFFNLKITGGPDGVKASDGSTLSADYTSSFSTGHVNIVDEPVLGGLDDVTCIRFSPDGRIFIAEKRGLIKEFDNINDTTPTVVADLSSEVYSVGDSGLMGMALHPNFPTVPYIYITYIYDGDPGGASPKWNSVGTQPYDQPAPELSVIYDDVTGEPIGGGATVSGRLSRLTISGNTMVPGSEWVMISDWRQQWSVHGLEDVIFGPDGNLYIGAGDGGSAEFQDIGQAGNPFNDPVNEGGAVRAQDILTSGDAQGLNGTIIRVDPNTGLGAAGNPFIGSSDVNKQRIIAWGVRNPFRLTFRPGTSELFLGDVGWATVEELNVIPNASDSVAENFGWPAYEGPTPSLGWASTITSKGITSLQNLYANPSQITQPFYSYTHGEKIVAGSNEVLTGGSSPSGMTFYQGTNFPAVFDKSLIFVDYARRQMYVMFAGADGKPDPSTRQILTPTPASGGAGPVDVIMGPDGALYYSSVYSGEVTLHRVRAVGYTDLPVAQFSVDKRTGGAPLNVSFTNSSFDPDNTALTYTWDLNGDGTYGDSTAANPTYTYNTPGDYVVRLKVTKASGQTDTSSPITIHVTNIANHPPVAIIDTPTSGTTWGVGDTINFSGSASDPDGDAVSVVWDIELRHSNDGTLTNFHRHTIGTVRNVMSGSFVAFNHEYPSWLAVRMTVTDSTGEQTIVERDLYPKVVHLNFTSNVPGIQVTVGSETHETPFTANVIAGSITTVSAMSPATLNGTNYVFSSWSNGQARTYDLLAPATDSTYSITYTAATTTELAGTIIGTEGAAAETPTLTRDAAFDNDTTTYFNAPIADGAWAGLDLGVGRIISAIGFAPREDDLASVIGGRFQASNTVDFTGTVVELLTLTSAPAAAGLQTYTANSFTPYRYVRYLAPAGTYGNIAELKFYFNDTGGGDVPDAPDNLAVSNTTSSSVTLRWVDHSSDETGFRIERRIGTAAWTTAGLVNPGVTTFTDTGLNSETQYEYRVRAVNNVGDSVASDTVLATTFNPVAPTTPTNLAATVLTGGRSVVLNWTDTASNETSFLLQRRYASWIWEDLTTVPANTTTYQDNSVSYDVAYEYRLLARNAVGDSPWSDGLFVDTGQLTIVAPAKPLNLSATTIAATSVSLQWTDDSSNESGFKIQRRAPGGTWADIASVGANVTTYTNTGLTNQTTYEYQVLATNRAGDSVPSDPLTVTTSGTVEPPAPGNIVATVATGGRSVSLTWGAVTGATGYALQRRYAGWIWEDVTTTDQTSFTDSTVIANVKYEYRLQALGTVIPSPWSAALLVDTGVASQVVPEPPTGLTAINDITKITLRWTHAGTGESGFKVQRREVGGEWSIIGTTQADIFVYSDDSAALDVAYEYRVYAYNGVGDSLVSNVAAATRTTNVGAAPATPGTFGAIISNSGKRVDLSWSDLSDNETGFLIQRRYAGWIWEDIAVSLANSTSFTDNTAIAAVTFEYRIQALGSGINSPFSNAIIVDTHSDTPAIPTAPINLRGGVVTSTRVDLVWTDTSANEDSFIIDRRQNGGAWDSIGSTLANAQSYSDTTVLADETYEYRVRAVNANGGNASNIVTVVTTLATAVPTAPSNLSATLTGVRQITLTWDDNASTENSYIIERRFAGWIWETVVTLGADTTNYVDTSMVSNALYEYRVYALNAAGASDPSELVQIRS